MKKLFTLILCAAVCRAFAQSGAEKDIKEQLWTKASPEFKVTKVPEQWKNESAVILAFKRDYVLDFATKMTGVMNVNRFYVQKVNVHVRIKLLDKAAVNTYSELAFDNKNIRTNIFGRSSEYSFMAAKIIKPNGTEKEVNFSDAVKTDIGSSKDLKIPIPNLEPGDILDYYFAAKSESLSKPVISDTDLLERKHPIVKAIYRFSIPHQFQFKSVSFNEAPEFDREEVDKDVVYTLTDEMRSKAPDLLWEYEYRTSPSFGYRISADDYSTPKSSANSLLDRFLLNTTDVGFIEDYINGNFKKITDQKKIVTEVVHLLNNPIYKKAYFNIDQDDPLEAAFPGDLYFALLNKYFQKKKIGHDVLIVPSRTYGSFSDIMNLESCDLMIRVNTKPAIYIQRPGPFTIPGDIPATFEGMDVAQKSFQTASGPNLMPVSSAADNSTATNLTLVIDSEDNSKIDVKRDVIAKGHNKTFEQYLIFTNYDYLKEYDLPKYQVESSRKLKGLISDYNKEKNKFEQRKTQDYNERDQRIKQSLESEMDVKLSDYRNLQIKNIGMWYDKPVTEYSDEFVIENIVKKAGPNSIVDIGKLIEKQSEVPEEQKTRTRDVYMSNPRTYTYEIEFTIPAGFTVEGVENLRKKTEGEQGGFISEARMEGSILKITTKKYYTKNHYTSAEWPKILEFLKSSVDFYNAKILLKKA